MTNSIFVVVSLFLSFAVSAAAVDNCACAAKRLTLHDRDKGYTALVKCDDESSYYPVQHFLVSEDVSHRQAWQECLNVCKELMQSPECPDALEAD